jgi:hypothetical protein
MMGYSDLSGTSLGYADFNDKMGSTSYNGIYDPSTQNQNCAGTTASLCTRTQFTNNRIPGNRISQAATYINKYRLPYEATTLQTVYYHNLVSSHPTGLSNWYTSGRIDYVMSSKNQMTAILGFGRGASTGTNSSGSIGPPFNTAQSYAPKTKIVILKDIYTINSHMVNQFALAFGRYDSLSQTPNETDQYSSANTGILNMPAGQASYFPGIKWSGGADAMSTEGGYSENRKTSDTYTLMDNLQWQFGRHNLTLGGQVVDVQYNYTKNLTNSGPMTFTFSNNQTIGYSGTSTINTSGDAFASYMLGAVSGSSVSVGVPGLGSRWLNPSFWAQDDYKVTSKLTFNLGLRWDIFPSIHVTHDNFSWLNATGSNAVTGNLGTLAFAGGNSSDGYHTGVHNPSPVNLKNFAPRLGVAYSVTPKTVIRASYGLAYAHGNWNSGSQSGSPSTTGLNPSASAASTQHNTPQFYWDNTACSTGYNDGSACGWTGSTKTPSSSIPTATSSTGGTNLAMYGTGETMAPRRLSTSTGPSASNISSPIIWLSRSVMWAAKVTSSPQPRPDGTRLTSYPRAMPRWPTIRSTAHTPQPRSAQAWILRFAPRRCSMHRQD